MGTPGEAATRGSRHVSAIHATAHHAAAHQAGSILLPVIHVTGIHVSVAVVRVTVFHASVAREIAYLVRAAHVHVSRGLADAAATLSQRIAMMIRAAATGGAGAVHGPARTMDRV